MIFDGMGKVNLKDIEERELQSPKGKFGRALEAVALGGDRVDATKSER